MQENTLQLVASDKGIVHTLEWEKAHAQGNDEVAAYEYFFLWAVFVARQALPGGLINALINAAIAWASVDLQPPGALLG